MSSSNTYRRDNSERSQDRQLPPIRDHLRDVWDQRPASDTRYVAHPSSHSGFPSNSSHYTSSYESQSQTPRNDHYNRRSQPGTTYPSHSHPREPTTGGPYAVFDPDLQHQRTSDDPNFPRIPRASRDERRYQCTECPDRFDRQSALETHMRTHTQERPFICSKCGKGFTVKSNLRRHERTHTATSGFVPIDETNGAGGSSSRGHYSTSATQPPSKFYSSYRSR